MWWWTARSRRASRRQIVDFLADRVFRLISASLSDTIPAPSRIVKYLVYLYLGKPLHLLRGGPFHLDRVDGFHVPSPK